MRVLTLAFQRVCLSASILSLFIPAVAHANPTLREASTVLTAQAASPSQVFQSRQLKFRINIPQSYIVDTSKADQRMITFRNQAIPAAIGSDQPEENNQAAAGFGDQPQISASDQIRIVFFENLKRLSATDWAQQNDAISFLTRRQSEVQKRQFAGQPAVAYSWCSDQDCGDSIIVPSRDRRQIAILSVIYDYPGNSVRWDFQRMAGSFRFLQ